MILAAIAGIIALMIFGRQFGVHPLSDIAIKKQVFLPSDTGKVPTLEIKNFRLVQTMGRDKQWELNAEEAYEYEGRDEIEIHKTQVTFFKKGNIPVLTLKANEGIVGSESRDIKLRGSVEAITPDGMKINTESLLWSAKNEKLVTNDRVVVTKSGVRVEGIGLEADATMERLQVKKNVMVKVTK